MTSSHPVRHSSATGNDQGSFLSGFALGLFAGAAGYFMFGTPKGRKLRERLVEEWEHARMELGEQGLPNTSLRDMLRSLVKSIQETSEAQTEKGSQKKAPKSSKDTKDSKAKFKGL